MSEITSLKNLDVKNIRISLLPEKIDEYKITYNKKPLRLKIEFLDLSHPYSGILDSRKVTFKSKKINPLYIYFKKDDEITKKLKELSDQIKEIFKKEINFSFINDSKMTFKFKTNDNVITTKIDGIKNIRNTDKLVDKLDLKKTIINVVVRFKIISNSYGNFIQMIMDNLDVIKEIDSEESEISVDDE